jgi:2-amino-4-hydroxy-6-hydroxymethyldihydropteridine diphosphokinase
VATRAYIGLGSNLGDSPAILIEALEDLDTSTGIELKRVSANYRTAPVGGPSDQPDFQNAAAELVTELEPRALLARLHEIERAHGRRRELEQRWGPRTLDLDLLVYGELELTDEELELPHPRLEQRRFVLEPLAEIAPRLVLPCSGRTVSEALAALLRDELAAGAVPRG